MNAPDFVPIGLETISTDELKPLTDLLPGTLPHQWREFCEHVFITLRKAPEMQVLPTAQVAEIALRVALQIGHAMGGSSVYIPKGLFGRIGQSQTRAEAVRREFKGNNHLQLARKYSVTEMRVRQILGNGIRSKQGQK